MLTRKLGFWETLRQLSQTKGHGTSTIVAIARIKGPLTPDLISEALQIQFKRHPLLQAHIKKTEDTYQFVLDRKFNDIPLAVINRNNDNQWQLIVEKELDTPLQTENYLWRINFLYNETETSDQHELLFTLHHGIGDGFSVAYFMYDVLKILQQCYEHADIELPSLPFLSCVEEILPEKLNWEQFINKLLADPSPAIERWHYEAAKPLGERHTRIIYQHLNIAQLKQLKTRCHNNHVTINSALSAALILSAYTCQPHYSNISLLTLVDLRKYCQPELSRDHVGCYVTSVTTQHALSDAKANFWQIAKDYQEKLHSKISKNIYTPVQFNLTNLENFSIANPRGSTDKTKTTESFSVDLAITNLGYLDFPKIFGPFVLDEFYFCTSRQAGDIAIIANITSMQDQMFLSFGYTEPLLSKKTAENIVNVFMNTINRNA